MPTALNRPGRKYRVLMEPCACAPSEPKMLAARGKCAPNHLMPIGIARGRVGARQTCLETLPKRSSTTNAGQMRAPTLRLTRANDAPPHSIRVATAENSCAHASSALWPERHAILRNRSTLASDCFGQQRSRREPPCFAERARWDKIMVHSQRAHPNNTAHANTR